MKIFDIVRRFSSLVEKASCDEAYADVTSEVNKLFAEVADSGQYFPTENNIQAWNNAYFFGHKTIGEGVFVPETVYDKKLFIANEIAHRMRTAINDELGYKASCGIGHNKTLAKLGSAQNKPNAQTVVPIRYAKEGMAGYKINEVRMCGGKIGEVLARNGVQTMGEIQDMAIEDLRQMGFVLDTAQWLKGLS